MGDTSSAGRHFLIGGYPAAPSWAGDSGGVIRFTEELLGWRGPVGRSLGLEVPYAAASPWADPSVLAATPSTSRHVLTMIPTTMTELRSRAEYGLASIDDDGRRAAVADVRRAVEFARVVNAGNGGLVVAIELQSAPRSPRASAQALGRSLEELARLELDGVRLWVEHCDAQVRGQDFGKGFLSLDDEIGLADHTGHGIVLNWGRSAIELRSADRVTEHVAVTAAAGALRGLMFSGVASEPTDYGPPWVDAHLPVTGSLGDDPRGAVFDASLLTTDLVERALGVVGGLDLACVGIKMGMPAGTPDGARLAMLQANVELIAGLVDVAPAPDGEQDVAPLR